MAPLPRRGLWGPPLLSCSRVGCGDLLSSGAAAWAVGRTGRRGGPLRPGLLLPTPRGMPLFEGASQFGAVSIALDGAASPLNITTVNQGPANVYVQGVTWNGAPVTGVTVPYASLMAGGVLEFTMSPVPTTGRKGAPTLQA